MWGFGVRSFWVFGVCRCYICWVVCLRSWSSWCVCFRGLCVLCFCRGRFWVGLLLLFCLLDFWCVGDCCLEMVLLVRVVIMMWRKIVWWMGCWVRIDLVWTGLWSVRIIWFYVWGCVWGFDLVLVSYCVYLLFVTLWASCLVFVFFNEVRRRWSRSCVIGIGWALWWFWFIFWL